MIKLSGVLLNVFTSSDYTDKETGVITKGKTKLQLLVKQSLRNGEFKNELLDISIPIDKVSKYKGKENSEVTVDVGMFGKVTFYGI